MENQAGCFSMHLIDADGNFDADGLDNFVKHAKLEECGGSYAVVAIMGPHSSGKSTLLNHLFDTDFKEMDADSGRSPTTHGIWMARSAGTEPCTVVMDLQGSNRGEDDTAFEQQSALFALNISDIVLINMWCHDIGYGQAAHKLLLKTVFETMFKSSAIPPRARTLLFVLRDKTKTPLEKLEPLLKEDIWKIWDSVTKPKTHSDMTNIFNVQVVALPSYEVMEQQFKSEVASLRQKFSFAPDGLAGNMQEAVDASVFSSTVQQFWKSIKEKKPAVAQQIKLTTSAKMFAGLKLSSEKVELMKDSPFKSLASLASKDNARESNALYVQALCRLYDPSKMLCYLNEHVSFSFCRKEVARVLGMEDSGLDFNEYDKECGTYKREFSDFVYVLKNEFGKPKNPVLHTSEIVSILDNMSVATEDQKTQFKKLMSFYVIERFLRCGTNKTKPRMETWRLVIDLEKCWSVNWTQATFDHLHVAMTNCREWWDKCRPSQHNFTGCAPVLEAISFERIQKIRPKILDHLMLPVGKYDSKRGEFGDSLIGLVTEDIDRCPDCCTVSMDNLSLSNENYSEPGSVLVDTELVKDNQSTEEEPKDATEGSMTQNADQPEKVQVQPRPKEPKKVQEQRKSERIRNNKRKNEVASSSGATHEMEPTKTKRA